jgi:hypothetical protein
MEQKYREFCKLEKSTYDIIAKQVQVDTVKFSDIKYEDPSIVLRKCFEDFMIRAQVVIRHRNKMCMIIFNEDRFEEGDYRRSKLIEKLNQKKDLLGKDLFNFYKMMMKEDKVWLTALTQTRDKIEHVENKRIKITDFEVKLQNNNVVVNTPVYLDLNERCDIFMNNMFTNLYLHLEDFISMIINLMSDGSWIINLFPDDDYSNTKLDWYSIDLENRIYRIDLQKDYKDRFLSQLKANNT